MCAWKRVRVHAYVFNSVPPLLASIRITLQMTAAIFSLPYLMPSFWVLWGFSSTWFLIYFFSFRINFGLIRRSNYHRLSGTRFYGA